MHLRPSTSTFHIGISSVQNFWKMIEGLIMLSQNSGVNLTGADILFLLQKSLKRDKVH